MGDRIQTDFAAHETNKALRTRAQFISFCGLSIALLAISAMIIIPLGPVPFTMQTLVVVLCVLVLTSKESIAAIGGYLILGTIGLPIFAGMKGGIGVLLGPSGGFLIGFLLSPILIALLSKLFSKIVMKQILRDVMTTAIIILLSYFLGWTQLMIVTGMTPAAAFFAAVTPFIIPDVVKSIVAIQIARPIRKIL